MTASDDWPGSQFKYRASRLVYYGDICKTNLTGGGRANNDDIGEMRVLGDYFLIWYKLWSTNY